LKLHLISDSASVVLASSAVATCAVGAYIGTLASLAALTIVLAARVVGGRSELRTWTQISTPSRAVAVAGPISNMAAVIHNAAAGDRYARTEIEGILTWLVRTEKSGLEVEGGAELGDAKRSLLSILKEPKSEDGLPAPQQLRGKRYIQDLERKLVSIRDG
jgi:hypothetical protein